MKVFEIRTHLLEIRKLKKNISNVKQKMSQTEMEKIKENKQQVECKESPG